MRTLFFASFLALLSLLLRSNSMTRRSYGARPLTSRTISLTNSVRFDRWPLVLPTRGFVWRGVTFCGRGKSKLVMWLTAAASCPKCCGEGVSTYMARVDADGNARLLLGFLRHFGCVFCWFRFAIDVLVVLDFAGVGCTRFTGVVPYAEVYAGVSTGTAD